MSSSRISRVLEQWRRKKILDEEAHLRLYRGVRNVTVGLHSLHYGQFAHQWVGVTPIDEAPWLL